MIQVFYKLKMREAQVGKGCGMVPMALEFSTGGKGWKSGMIPGDHW